MKPGKISKVSLLLVLAFVLMAQNEVHPDYYAPAEEEITVGDKVAKLNALEKEAFYTRVEQLIEERLEQCKENGILQATRYVDSLIIEEALQNRRLEFLIPPKPGKPGASGLDFNLDSLQIAPIIKDTTN